MHWVVDTSSLAHALPSMIHLTDFDVQMLLSDGHFDSV